MNSDKDPKGSLLPLLGAVGLTIALLVLTVLFRYNNTNQPTVPVPEHKQNIEKPDHSGGTKRP